MASSVTAELLALASLSLLPISWMRHIAERLRAGEPAPALFARLVAERSRADADRFAWIPGRAAAAIERARERGIDTLAWSEVAYPPALAAIVDPPPLLWVHGSADALAAQPVVAIVGARAASPYGLAVAERLAGDLAARGVMIVSGLARGVDSAAHRGALAGGGITVAVLGSGVDVIYPPEHAALAREIPDRGALVSEFVPGTPPNPFFFPQRNRIISGLARAVVVIEAGEKSGSLITARAALEQGRDVLAVPGNILTGRNRGAHGLLRDGAKIVETADDILEELHLAANVNPSAPAGASEPVKGRVDAVLACLPPGEPCDLDEIAERSGLDSARLLPRLFELEVQGLLRRAGGGRFVRIDRPC
jgi:DNA processing protein